MLLSGRLPSATPLQQSRRRLNLLGNCPSWSPNARCWNPASANRSATRGSCGICSPPPSKNGLRNWRLHNGRPTRCNNAKCALSTGWGPAKRGRRRCRCSWNSPGMQRLRLWQRSRRCRCVCVCVCANAQMPCQMLKCSNAPNAKCSNAKCSKCQMLQMPNAKFSKCQMPNARMCVIYQFTNSPMHGTNSCTAIDDSMDD